MSQDDKNDILQQLSNQINDLVLHAHNSKNKEVSGLFAEIKLELKQLRGDFSRLEISVSKLEDLVTPNINTWNKSAESINWATKLVIGTIITALLGTIIILK